MGRTSAGLLMYHYLKGNLRVLLIHPGGPYFAGKDEGHWSIPKGGVEPGEELLDAARREFEEETGFKARGDFLPLKPIKQKSGKIVHAWAVEGRIDTAKLKSIRFTMEWPRRSGKQMEFAEVDRGEFFDIATAKQKLKAAQFPLVEELVKLLKTAQKA